MLNSYIILFSGFRIRRFKLILNSKNLLRIPYIARLMHFFNNNNKTQNKQINKQTKQNKTKTKTQNKTKTYLKNTQHQLTWDLHLAQLFSLEAHKISSA